MRSTSGACRRPWDRAGRATVDGRRISEAPLPAEVHDLRNAISGWIEANGAPVDTDTVQGAVSRDRPCPLNSDPVRVVLSDPQEAGRGRLPFFYYGKGLFM